MTQVETTRKENQRLKKLKELKEKIDSRNKSLNQSLYLSEKKAAVIEQESILDQSVFDDLFAIREYSDSIKSPLPAFKKRQEA